jgi:hypothetical protein
VSDRSSTRVLVAVVGVIAVAAFAFAVLLPLIGRLGCEDAEQPAFDTVRCDGERGAGWRSLQSVLFVASAALVVAGIVVALRRARFRPLLLSLAGVAVALCAGAINGIELGDKTVPKLEMRLLDEACSVPCEEGIAVSVTVDREAELTLGLGPARFRDIGSRQYSSSIVGERDAVTDVDAGTHELSVTGEILNPPAQRGPLPAGLYEVHVTARPQDSGHQEDAESGTQTRRVRITSGTGTP